MNNRWFKFYIAYYSEFEKVSIFNAKKLLLALCEYTEYGFLTVKLNKKTFKIYEKIITMIEFEKSYYKKMGKTGAKKRWNNENLTENRGAIKKNRGGMPKK